MTFDLRTLTVGLHWLSPRSLTFDLLQIRLYWTIGSTKTDGNASGEPPRGRLMACPGWTGRFTYTDTLSAPRGRLGAPRATAGGCDIISRLVGCDTSHRLGAPLFNCSGESQHEPTAGAPREQTLTHALLGWSLSPFSLLSLPPVVYVRACVREEERERESEKFQVHWSGPDQ